MIALLAAFQFLTILPAVIKRVFTPDELGRSVGFYPLVGLALGGALYGLESGLLLILPESITTVLVLAAWIVMTRALHFDGFLDACDGLFGSFSPERRLEIMRDSRVGAFAVAGGTLFLLAKAAAIQTIRSGLALILAPVVGRWLMSLAIVLFPYARQQGLGRDMKDQAGWIQAALATIITAGVALWLYGWPGLIVAGGAALAALLGLGFVLARIPGLTGDIYGATCEMAELLVLIVLASSIWP